MTNERRATVRTVSDAAVGDKTVADSMVAETTIPSPNKAFVFENRNYENNLKQFSTIPQPKFTDIMETI